MDIKTSLAVISMVIAAVSAFFAWQIATQDGLNDLAQRVSAIESGTEALNRTEIENLISVAISESNESASSTNAITKSEVLEILSSRLEPLSAFMAAKGAVIAFDRSEDRGGGVAGGACPVGWKLFREAGGRVIVGAGQHENTDLNGEAITRYPAMSDNEQAAIGGSQEHGLSIDEMPPHDHVTGTVDVQGITIDSQGNGNDNVIMPYFENGSGTVTEGRTVGVVLHAGGKNGEVASHNNMPPYVALYFCKKEE